MCAINLETRVKPLPDGTYALIHELVGSDTVTPPGTSVPFTVDELLPFDEP